MSKITNDGLTRSGTGCFIAVLIWQQWASKGYASIQVFVKVLERVLNSKTLDSYSYTALEK